MSYHSKSIKQILKNLQTSNRGLSSEEAEKRLKIYGHNQTKVHKQPIWKIIIEPFANVFMLVLAVAAILSIIHHEPLDASIVAVIMIANALIFYTQTYSTQKVLRTLEKKSKRIAIAIRNGKEVEIDTTEIVPGDIVLISEGEKVPADGRILNSNQLQVNESQLTGESDAVLKSTDEINKEAQIYERTNMVYQGSFVVSGNAIFAVTATGNKTEFGAIASLVKKNELVSPIQKKIDNLLSKIITVVLAVSIVAFGLALVRGMDIIEATRFVLAITVSAIPESLPVAISVILVLGMRRMAAKKALVQTMRSIETIGAVTTIATDKTGTLTYNRLRVEKTWSMDLDEKSVALIAAKTISPGKQNLSDPLDQALHNYIKKQNISLKNKPANSFAFSQDLAMSGALWHNGETYKLYVKGAPEHILQRSHLNKSEIEEATKVLASFTENGYRVIAIASLDLKNPINSLDEIPVNSKLIFGGLLAIADQIRPEAKSAIKSAQKAGVSVRMITGDHPETAFFIGKKLDMVDDRSQIFNARNMDKMSEEELIEAIKNTRIFTRVIPEQKYKILTILKKDNIAAMTGDGVNDVPALSNAHVGLAMGSGSHIAKDAGDIILLDDNFKTIVDAIKEGRTIINNVRRMLFYLLSTNAGEMITMIISLAAGIPVPLVPVQILWVNLVTDSCMVIPLGLEPADKNILSKKPDSPNSPILSNSMIIRMLMISITMAILTIYGFIYFNQAYGTDYARTISFHILVITQLAATFSARSDYESALSRLRVWSLSFYIGLSIALAMHLATLFTPLGKVLHIVPVSALDLIITGIIAFVSPIIVSEMHKLYIRKKIKSI